jgi:nicotinate-nucleotide pyrophosphorylase (carboxylating)
MPLSLFHRFFQEKAHEFLVCTINVALAEDGLDRTSQGVFTSEDRLKAEIIAKERTIVAGLPLIEVVLKVILGQSDEDWQWSVSLKVQEGSAVEAGTLVAELEGPAIVMLQAERIILNFIQHLSGIANQTRCYVVALGSSPTKLLDTRKTLPGLRYPEKYAVLLGGGHNHRMNLWEMLMLKDNHIDRAGGIRPAVEALRATYPDDCPPPTKCPPIEVECRTLAEVETAAACKVDRIMLDNMDIPLLEQALKLIPPGIESEVSGGVTLATISDIARLQPDYISVGALTHSAPAADFSMRIDSPDQEKSHG